MSSSPMLRRPMRGFATPYTSRAMMAPMAANWRSCSGVALVLAPRSSMWVCPCAAGIAEMIAARSTPGRVPSTKCAIAVSAPVLPALTHAQAVPASTRSTATRIEDCFLWRIASRGLSCIDTTCEAPTTVARLRTGSGRPARAADISCGSPTSWVRSSGSARRARTAPARYSRGSWSPLITSIATGSTQPLLVAARRSGAYSLSSVSAGFSSTRRPR